MHFYTLGAKGHLPTGYSVSLLWVLKQFSRQIPTINSHYTHWVNAPLPPVIYDMPEYPEARSQSQVTSANCTAPVSHMVVANVIIDRKWGVHWEIGKRGKSTFPIRKTWLTCHLCIPSPLNKAPGLSPRSFSRAQRPSDASRRSWNMIEGNIIW